jgi:pimeloyl-ACP methyl ester carboxylesterase
MWKSYQSGVLMVFILSIGLAPLAAAQSQCPAIDWHRVSPAALDQLRLLPVDRSVVQHNREKRGFVSVPMDYDNPKGKNLDIFYRLMPSSHSVPAISKKPILLIINGGPGMPSRYRALDYQYGEANPRDRLAALAKYFRILTVDQRGTGMSSPLDLNDPGLSPALLAKLFDADEHASDHARVVDAVIPKDEPFLILARSYGGHIGLQYLLMRDRARQPAGFIFDSALLPNTDALNIFTERRKEQHALNRSLLKSNPELVNNIKRLRQHFTQLGLPADSVNYLWEYLGKSTDWQEKLSQKVNAYLAMNDKSMVDSELSQGIRSSVNLLNYVLSSASITPGYTDKSLAQKMRTTLLFDDWMLDEAWTLAQIGNDGAWRQQLICSVDRQPPPGRGFDDLKILRQYLSQTKTLFTYGRTDAFLPYPYQLGQASQLFEQGDIRFRVFSGGHGAAFSPEGAGAVSQWAQDVLPEQSPPVDFEALMNRVAVGWSTLNTELAISAFSEAALYTEPPNLQIYRGHKDLTRLFDALTPGTSMNWHRLWFDPQTGTGGGEYTFHKAGREYAVHGVTVVEIEDGKIQTWREYQRRGPVGFADFIDPSDKDWEWTANHF